MKDEQGLVMPVGWNLDLAREYGYIERRWLKELLGRTNGGSAP